MAIPTWARFMLDNYTLGQLQSGFRYKTPLRDQNRSPDGHWVIKETSRRVYGTGIPASTLKKFRDGIWTPRKRTLDKLRTAYKRFTYNQLKMYGASTDEARALSTYNADKMKQQIHDRKKILRVMCERTGVSAIEMVWSMQSSTHMITIDYVDKYDISLDDDEDE